MSDPTGSLRPAIGLLEFESIVAGIVAGDAMVKAAPVSSLFAGTVHPGRYLVLVGGDTASVEIALEAGGGETLSDSLFLADVHPAVLEAIRRPDEGAGVDGDALGIIETATAATAIVAADAGVKAAAVGLPSLQLSDGLGGKAYCLFSGPVADVEAAVDDAVARIEHRERLVASRVIPQLHDEMRDNLTAELRFNGRLRRSAGGS